jgi:hypothetical protein
MTSHDFDMARFLVRTTMVHVIANRAVMRMLVICIRIRFVNAYMPG